MLVAFWHVVTINNWHDILCEQLGKLVATGLYASLDVCHTYVNGDLAAVPSLPAKFRVVHNGDDVRQWEIPTMIALDRMVRGGHVPPGAAVLYFHLKGAGRADPPSQHNVSYWRRYMEYFCIERWRDCVGALAGCDACGCDINYNPWPHFAGNFWWANASHLLRLYSAEALKTSDPVGAELHIGHAPGPIRLHQLWQSGLNLYQTNYLPSNYRGQAPRMPQGVARG